jgi:hypothetical protein
MYNPKGDIALYLERAAEYVRLAESATRDDIKADYQRMADLCLKIAEGLRKIAESQRRMADDERKSKQ